MLCKANKTERYLYLLFMQRSDFLESGLCFIKGHEVLAIKVLRHVRLTTFSFQSSKSYMLVNTTKT